jgi:hypothetical protein
MHTVRVRQQPDREIEVDDAEYLDLKRQGLLVDDPDEQAEATEPPVPPEPEQSVGVDQDPPAGPAPADDQGEAAQDDKPEEAPAPEGDPQPVRRRGGRRTDDAPQEG